MNKRVAVIHKNKVIGIRITHDINELKTKLGESYDIIEIVNKKVKIGQSWFYFPTVRKAFLMTKNLFSKPSK